MVYDQPNFTGQQYLLTIGEYPEYQNTIGFNSCIQSCRIVPVVNMTLRYDISDPGKAKAVGSSKGAV